MCCTMYGIIVFGSLRFRLFTRKRSAGVFKNTALWGLLLMLGNTVSMDGKLNGEKKISFFKNTRVRVDKAQGELTKFALCV